MDILMHRGKSMWGHGKKADIRNPRREASKEIKPANTLIADFQPPEMWENKFLFKPHSLWYFVMVALED